MESKEKDYALLVDRQADFLISLADVLLLFAEEGRREEFIAKLEDYVQRLQELDQNVPKILFRLQEKELPYIKSQLERLYALHKEVVRISENLRNAIGVNLDELHQKSNGLKKYLGVANNKEPISLTGTRKG